MGSSGSAASAGDAGAASRGGNGGGAIDLRAGKIEISGQLVANGNDGSPSDEAAGAGSGGGIRILAWVFTTYDTTTVFKVAGGIGGKSKDYEGGAGAGGRIFLFVPQAPAQVFTALVDGGKGTCATAWGADGVVQPGVSPLDCADLDSDGVFSNECVAPKGDDCDDSDPAVHPGAAELCNNADDDCDGLVDNGADADCGGGTCENGKCTAPDAGPDAELPDAAEEDAPEPADAPVEQDAGSDGAPDAVAAEPSNEFTLRGGCSQSRGSDAGAWISLIMIALATVQRRRR
ncbi:MAG: putative metal-binding motif-containing protein [Deltaproteobacteria bacterium]|nr:putative metal-binding motif-containing protein [Deltaproteobacteria bacterium]